MPRECRSWERGHPCPRNAVRPLGVFRTRIAGKDARAPRIGLLRNISYSLIFFPLFSAAPQASGLPWLHRSNVAQAAKPALSVARRRVLVFSNRARLRLVGRLGSLRYVRGTQYQ
jgi:hypothetical protein